jgi:hypothetical protein
VRVQSEPFAKCTVYTSDSLEAGNFLSLSIGDSEARHRHLALEWALTVNVTAVMRPGAGTSKG